MSKLLFPLPTVLASRDPSVNVVLLEDLAAVLGVIVCSTCMGLTHVYGSHIPDAVGSLLVGGLLGGVASFIIYSNVAGLVGRCVCGIYELYIKFPNVS